MTTAPMPLLVSLSLREWDATGGAFLRISFGVAKKGEITRNNLGAKDATRTSAWGTQNQRCRDE